METLPKFATAAEVAAALGITKNALDRQRCVAPENGPPFVKIGRRVFYPLNGPHSLAAWLAVSVEGGVHA